MGEYKVRFRFSDIEVEISSSDENFVEKQLNYWTQYINNSKKFNNKDEKTYIYNKKAIKTTIPDNNGKKGELEYTEVEKNLIKLAKDSKRNCFELHICLMPGCAMKSVRITMILQVLEKYCEIIKIFPNMEKIISEQVGDNFIFTLISSISPETIRDVINSISEIQEVKTIDLLN